MTFVPLSRLTTCFVWPQLTENPCRTSEAEFRRRQTIRWVVLLKSGLRWPTLMLVVSSGLVPLLMHLGSTKVAGQFRRPLTNLVTCLILGALINVYRMCMGLPFRRQSTLFPLTSRRVFGWLRTACELTTEVIWKVICVGKPVPTAFATTPAAGCRAVTTVRTFIVWVSRVTW